MLGIAGPAPSIVAADVYNATESRHSYPSYCSLFGTTVYITT